MDDKNNQNKDDWSNHWDEYADSARQNPAQDLRHSIILREIKNIRGDIDTLLDVGSGQGDFLFKVSNHKIAQKLIGFELSESGVNISKEKVPTADFFQVDMFSPPEVINKFQESSDIIVCSDVIEHVDEPIEFLKCVRSYLRPNGSLLLTVPGGPMSEFDHYIGHRTHYNKSSIIDVLQKAGFKVDAVKLAGFPFFNIYRLVVILRGKKLIADVKSGKDNQSNKVAIFMMSIFKYLFKFNISNFPIGWQVFAIAHKVE